MLRLKKGDSSQEITFFWVMRQIKYASLKLANYTSWNVKVNCEEHILARLKWFFHSQEILGKDWVKNTNIFISMLLKQNYIRDQILAIKDGNKRE